MFESANIDLDAHELNPAEEDVEERAESPSSGAVGGASHILGARDALSGPSATSGRGILMLHQLLNSHVSKYIGGWVLSFVNRTEAMLLIIGHLFG